MQAITHTSVYLLDFLWRKRQSVWHADLDGNPFVVKSKEIVELILQSQMTHKPGPKMTHIMTDFFEIEFLVSQYS